VPIRPLLRRGGHPVSSAHERGCGIGDRCPTAEKVAEARTPDAAVVAAGEPSPETAADMASLTNRGARFGGLMSPRRTTR